jgi:hypothetical protein
MTRVYTSMLYISYVVDINIVYLRPSNFNLYWAWSRSEPMAGVLSENYLNVLFLFNTSVQRYTQGRVRQRHKLLKVLFNQWHSYEGIEVFTRSSYLEQ